MDELLAQIGRKKSWQEEVGKPIILKIASLGYKEIPVCSDVIPLLVVIDERIPRYSCVGKPMEKTTLHGALITIYQTINFIVPSFELQILHEPLSKVNMVYKMDALTLLNKIRTIDIEPAEDEQLNAFVKSASIYLDKKLTKTFGVNPYRITNELYDITSTLTTLMAWSKDLDMPDVKDDSRRQLSKATDALMLARTICSKIERIYESAQSPHINKRENGKWAAIQNAVHKLGDLVDAVREVLREGKLAEMAMGGRPR